MLRENISKRNPSLDLALTFHDLGIASVPGDFRAFTPDKNRELKRGEPSLQPPKRPNILLKKLSELLLFIRHKNQS